MGSFWDDFGMILESFLDHVSVDRFPVGLWIFLLVSGGFRCRVWAAGGDLCWFRIVFLCFRGSFVFWNSCFVESLWGHLGITLASF